LTQIEEDAATHGEHQLLQPLPPIGVRFSEDPKSTGAVVRLLKSSRISLSIIKLLPTHRCANRSY
jgi:hypothetical protein